MCLGRSDGGVGGGGGVRERKRMKREMQTVVGEKEGKMKWEDEDLEERKETDTEICQQHTLEVNAFLFLFSFLFFSSFFFTLPRNSIVYGCSRLSACTRRVHAHKQ